MVSLDWERIRSADVDKLLDDEDSAEDFVEMIVNANMNEVKDESNNPALMVKLFEISKLILNIKSSQYEAAVEEMENYEKGDQLKEYEGEIEQLHADLEQYKKYDGTGDKYLRTEIHQLEDKNQVLLREIDDLEKRLLKEQHSYDRMNTEMNGLEGRYQEMKRDLDRAHTDIKEYQRQFTSQRDVKRVRVDNAEAVREEMVKKNREISGYLDELKNLQLANDQLQKDIGHSKDELQQATDDMNSMTNHYSKLKSVLQDTEIVGEEMRKERDALRYQVQDLQKQVQLKADGDDQLMSALNEKIADWKDIMSGKDEEIKESQQQITELEKKLQASHMDSDKQAMTKLMESNVEKEEQINILKDKLELATKDCLEVTTHINQLRNKTKDGAPSVYQQQQIQTLNAAIEQDKMVITMEKLRVDEAEKDVIDKDKEIAELVNKLIQYEQGQYGLAEAVKELKDSRAQIRVRDTHVQELTQEVNKLHIEINDLSLENEEMRERLGLESREDLDLVAIRRKKAVKEEQAVALNSVLQKEVERLEEERVELKKALRQQALDRGEKAVHLNLTAKDLEPLDDNSTSTSKRGSKSPESRDNSVKRKLKFEDGSSKDYDFLLKQNNKLEYEMKELKDENKQFEIGLRELNGVIREGVCSTSAIQVPAMDKLIAMIEQRSATGQVDTSVHLKEEIHHLHGRNEELRCELRNSQAELNYTIVQLDKGIEKIADQENEIDILRNANQNVVKVNPLPLPDGIVPTSKEIIACLNEYLIQILQELHNKEELCVQMQNILEDTRRKYSVTKHQQSILYKEYLELKGVTEKEVKLFAEEKNDLLLQKSHDAAKIQEFDKLLDNLEACDTKPKKLVAELTRKMVVLRVNEKSLTRRYTIIQEVEKNLRKENAKLRKDMLNMESAVTTKIGDLERHKELSCYKITSLEKQLEYTVPSLELEIANNKLNDLTAKYRDLLQRENTLVGRSNALEGLQAELAAFLHSENTLKEKLQWEKERSYVLEQTLNDLLHKLGTDVDGNPPQSEEVSSLARKLATLEMKELNEKERADHATMKYEHLRTLTGELEKRNAELEQNFAEIAKVNLESQRVERDLREQLKGSVPAEVNQFDKNMVAKLEEQESTLKLECHKLKEIADISQNQVEVIMSQQQSQEKELTSVRKQLYELQMETDEKTIIAKLHQHIVAMQISESAAVRKYEVATKKLSKKELQILQLQQAVHGKDDTLHHLRVETRSKVRFLKKTIQDLRSQFSGALTLRAQEKFTGLLCNLQDKKNEYERKLNEIQLKHRAAEEQSMELKIKNDGLQELIATLKDGQGAKKVAEWHTRMGDIKLEDMKLKRQIELDKEQISYMERVIAKHENSTSMLEKDLAKQAKDFEDRQLLWEQHEVELERSVARLEAQQKELSEAARKFEEATGSIPDNALPLANQLELAVSSIKEHIKTIIVTRAECKRMTEIRDDMDKKFRYMETSLMEKDKVINELRLRLPFSERDIAYEKALANSHHISKSKEDNSEAAQAFRVAQTTIESLKLMLAKKEANIGKYQEMAKTSREELKVQTKRHQQEIKVLQDRLQLEIEEHVKKMKRVHEDYLDAPQQNVPTNKQIQRLLDMEELLVEQDGVLGAAEVRHDSTQDDIKKLKKEAAYAIRTLNEQMKAQQEESNTRLQNMNREMGKVKTTVREKELEIEVLNQEVDTAREASKKAPSETMRNLVERLRDQLAKKDKEQKALSQALLQIQSDMVATAEDNVKAYAQKVEGEKSIQSLIGRQTSELRSQNDDLQSRVNKMTKDLKKKKETESNLAVELDSITKEMYKKDQALKMAAAELENIEDFKSKYEHVKAENKKLFQEQKRKEVAEPLIQPKEAFVQLEGVDMTDLDDKPVKEVKEFKGRDEVLRWEENKKWQKKVDVLKGKLKEKSDECEKLSKTNNMLREGFERQDKDKLALQNRIKSISRGLAPTDSVAYGMSLEQEETVAGLKQRIFQLEEENNDLTRKLSLDRDQEIQELRIQISQQNESIHALETQLLKKQKQQDPDGSSWIMERERSLKKEMLAIRKENMELAFEREQANKDVPRLKGRVADLQGYVEILKGEIEKMEKKEKSRKSAMGKGMGGQSVEDMERVIGAMRRVVERLQVENEALKKVAGKSKRPPCGTDLAKENRILKQEVQKLKQLRSTENKKTNPFSNGATQLAEDNDKLFRQLQKEREAKEELRVERNSLQLRNEKLLAAVEEKNLELLKNGSNPTVQQRQVEFILNNEASKEVVQALQMEIDKKNSILKETKVHLMSAAEREASLLRQIDALEEKVTLLQEFPTGVETENNAVKYLQQSKLQVSRLEAEKKELTFELNRLKELTSNGETNVDVTQDEILAKLQNYDKMMAVEVELRMKLKVGLMEREKLLTENKKLKDELSAFDPAFFEELEDLKYNYKISIERNVLYERQLRQLSQQFGVQVDIPD